MTALEKALRERVGGALFEQSLRDVTPLLDEAGMTAYFRAADLFMPFDPAVSKWMLRAAPALLEGLGSPETRREILEILLGMGRAKWSAAAAMLKKLPNLAEYGPAFVVQWLRHGSELADLDQDAALQYCDASAAILERMGTERFEQWASLGEEITRRSWKAAKEYFKSSPEVLKKIDPCDLEHWARLGIHLIEKSPEIKARYDAHSMLAMGSGAGKSKKLDLAIHYFKSAAQILSRLSIRDLEAWVAEGLESVDEHRERGSAFFSLQTGKSRQAVEGLVKGLELKDIHTVLRAYAEALTGTPVLIRSSSLFCSNLPGLGRFFSVTDGLRVFLPSQIAIFEDQELNFTTYKLALAHELHHILLGTFTVRLRDLNRLYGFADPALAFRIFEFLEDERVDYLMARQYPGLEKDRCTIMTRYLERFAQHPQDLSVFETVSFGVLNNGGDALLQKDPLTRLLIEALPRIRAAERTTHHALDLAVELCEALERTGTAAACENRRTSERLFYRALLDFDLVENMRSGMASLVFQMVERLTDKNVETSAKEVEEALHRIEASEGVESDLLLWQVEDPDRLDDLFQEVEQVLADMELEKHFRQSVLYDEWDRGLDDYKKEWCRVREMDMPETSSGFYDRVIAENYGIVSLLRRHFGLLRPDRIKRFFREERGDDIDYDALVESVVEHHAGVTPSDRIFIRREKNLRDVSVAFLVDMSYSTGDELPSGNRIIDVEREGLILMAEALESIGDAWAVYGFSTSYKEKVDFFVVRDFDMPFNDSVKMRFENIRPLQQTRLGAAIRHATRLLQRQTSRIRLLVLLSDGRPYDIDYGDADYAVEDTRRALWEGRQRGINSFCITVDKKSREYLPYMYGEANYTLIENLESLPVMLPLIYKRLTT